MLGICSAPAAVALAQSSNSAAQGSNVCMLRASSTATQNAIRIIAPNDAAAALEAKGFTQFPCAKGGFPIPTQIEFRDFICTVSSEYSEGMQKQFEALLGERPGVLCGLAEVSLGRWSRSRRGREIVGDD